MTNPLRVDRPGDWHHVMAHGVASLDLFVDDDDRIEFIRLLKKLDRRYGVEIHAFALLCNHFHLLVRSREGRLSEAMQYLLSTFARWSNRKNRRRGHLFQGRFESRNVDSERYLTTVIWYINTNPVKDGFVAEQTDWKWSSARDYHRGPEHDWLYIGAEATHPQGDQLSVSELNHVGGPPEEDLRFFRDDSRHPVIGDEPFRRSIERAAKLTPETVPVVRRIVDRPSIDELVGLVALVSETPTSALRSPVRGARNAPRIVAIRLTRAWTAATFAEIAEAYGLAGPGSASGAVGRELSGGYALEVERMTGLARSQAIELGWPVDRWEVEVGEE